MVYMQQRLTHPCETVLGTSSARQQAFIYHCLICCNQGVWLTCFFRFFRAKRGCGTTLRIPRVGATFLEVDAVLRIQSSFPHQRSCSPLGPQHQTRLRVMRYDNPNDLVSEICRFTIRNPFCYIPLIYLDVQGRFGHSSVSINMKLISRL